MLDRLSRLELATCVILLASITGLVFVASITRFFGYPLTWSVDTAQLLFIWLCFVGAARAMRIRGHLGMEILASRLGYKRQLWLEMAMSLIALAFLAVLVVEGAKLTLLNTERTFGDSSLSYAWVSAAVPVGCLLLAVALVNNMVEAWRGRSNGVLVYSRTSVDPDAPPPLEI